MWKIVASIAVLVVAVIIITPEEQIQHGIRHLWGADSGPQVLRQGPKRSASQLRWSRAWTRLTRLSWRGVRGGLLIRQTAALTRLR